jgi:adenosylcobinamide-GDP ribazoletransferase
VTAFLMVAIGILLTGAIHCDGLADFCDGFFGGKTKDQILSIMKDPRIGSFGVIALIMDLGFRFIAYYALISGKAFFVIAFSLVISRIMQSGCIAFLPYARQEAGTAAPFFGAKSLKWLVLAVCVVSYFIGSLFSGFIKPGFLFLSGIAATFIFLLFCRRKIGGITGDCIGACSELVENSVLLCGLFLI